ncbi:MAG TPA: hypothetical protein VF075_06580 [Pyrinomonadaceae bacterium]
MRKTILCFVVCVLSTIGVRAQTPTTSVKNAELVAYLLDEKAPLEAGKGIPTRTTSFWE